MSIAPKCICGTSPSSFCLSGVKECKRFLTKKCNCHEPYDAEYFQGGYPYCPIHDKPKGLPNGNINLMIVNWMIAEKELFLKIEEKNEAVRNQKFALAAKLLEQQHDIESRLPTLEQLHKLKKQIIAAKEEDNG
jgi:hypothetical protein